MTSRTKLIVIAGLACAIAGWLLWGRHVDRQIVRVGVRLICEFDIAAFAPDSTNAPAHGGDRAKLGELALTMREEGLSAAREVLLGLSKTERARLRTLAEEQGEFVERLIAIQTAAQAACPELVTGREGQVGVALGFVLAANVLP